jgi:hypothetical protein
LKLKFWAFKTAIDRPMNHNVRKLPIERFSARVWGASKNSAIGTCITYSFDPYFKNIGIQTMRDSTFERETHHVSLDGKLEKSISREQFCGCSKNRHVPVRNFI